MYTSTHTPKGAKEESEGEERHYQKKNTRESTDATNQEGVESNIEVQSEVKGRAPTEVKQEGVESNVEKKSEGAATVLAVTKVKKEGVERNVKFKNSKERQAHTEKGNKGGERNMKGTMKYVNRKLSAKTFESLRGRYTRAQLLSVTVGAGGRRNF